jgi:hypothetical protein
MKTSRIVRRLIDKAKGQTEEAYRILGAKPGPGLDLLVTPVTPMNGEWFAEGLTEAGKRFVFKFWMDQPFNGHKLARFKREAEDWSLTYRIKIPHVSLTPTLTKVDPLEEDE